MLENTFDNILLWKVIRAEHQEFEPEGHLDLACVEVTAQHEVYVVILFEVKDGIGVMYYKDRSAV